MQAAVLVPGKVGVGWLTLLVLLRIGTPSIFPPENLRLEGAQPARKERRGTQPKPGPTAPQDLALAGQAPALSFLDWLRSRSSPPAPSIRNPTIRMLLSPAFCFCLLVHRLKSDCGWASIPSVWDPAATH